MTRRNLFPHFVKDADFIRRSRSVITYVDNFDDAKLFALCGVGVAERQLFDCDFQHGWDLE